VWVPASPKGWAIADLQQSGGQRPAKRISLAIFQIFSLVHATNDCLPRREHFADNVPMKMKTLV
jgi:hypothetical protein